MIDSTAMRPTASDRTRKLIATARALTLAMALSFGAFTAAHAEPATIVAIGADNVNGKGKGKSYPGGVGRSDAFPAQLETLLRALPA